MQKPYETIIIGAGIAGITAGIYAARKKMNFLVIAEEFGGQMNISGEVLNYPGIITTTGGELRSILKKQVEFNGFSINEGEKVEQVKKSGKMFAVKTDKGSYSTYTVIVATGSSPKKLNVPGEAEFANKGVHYCAICDGPLYTQKKVAIIGGGNSALESVDFMKDIAQKIFVINIEEQFTAFQYLVDRLAGMKNVEVINKAETIGITGEKFVSGITYLKNKQENNLAVDGVFIEIGRTPNVEIVKDLLELNKHQHIIVDCQTQTSVPGVFAAGDVANVHEYQYIISAGQGCIALIKAAKYLARIQK